MNGNEWLENHQITVTSEPCDRSGGDWHERSQHYLVMFTPKEGDGFAIEYSVGPGIVDQWIKYNPDRSRRDYRPDAASVVECLAMDYCGIDSYSDYESWADAYGFDSDSLNPRS